MDKCREEFLKQHSSKVLKIVKFDESKNEFVLHDHLGLTDINLSALAEINYGWTLWQHLQAKMDELQKRVDAAIEAINEHYESDGMSGLYFMDLKEILEGEQALKGEGQ